MTEKLTKADLALLERAFEAEVAGALSRSGFRSFQSRSKRAAALVDRGYLASETVELGGRFPVNVSGYVLTEAGRLAYCESLASREGA